MQEGAAGVVGAQAAELAHVTAPVAHSQLLQYMLRQLAAFLNASANIWSGMHGFNGCSLAHESRI